jgi:hypothetical protein
MSRATLPSTGIRKVGERMRQLDAAARNPGMVLAAQLERRLVGQQVAGLGDAPLAAEYLASQDERRGAAAGLGQATLDHKQIGALSHLRNFSDCR